MTFFGDRHFDQTQCVEKSPKAKQYLVIQRVEKPEESPGKALLFVPQTRGSLDFARDDVFFGGSSFKNFQSSFININLEMVLLLVPKGLTGAKDDLSLRKFYFFIKFYLTS